MLKNIVFAIGMHRSGTSLLSRLVERRGILLPNDLISSHPLDNNEGYHESHQLLQINNTFLRDIDSDWKDPTPMSPSCFDSIQAYNARSEIKAFLTAYKGREGVDALLLKDPRLCRLLPLWLPVLNEMGLNQCALYIVRNPESVFQSLHRRSKIAGAESAAINSRDHAYLLWWRYNFEARKNLEGIPCHFLTYEHLLEAPKKEVKKISEFVHSHISCMPASKDPNIRTEKAHGLAIQGQQDIRSFLKSAYSEFARTSRLPFELFQRELCLPEGNFRIKNNAPYSCSRYASAELKKLSGSLPHLPQSDCKKSTIFSNLWISKKYDYCFITTNPFTRSHIYRIKNPVDALNRIGRNAIWLDLNSAHENLDLLKKSRIVILHRCPWNERIERIQTFLETHRIPVGFDIDDLLLHPNLIQKGGIDFIRRMPDKEKLQWVDYSNRLRLSAKNAEFIVVPTHSLADNIAEIASTCYVVRNGFSPENQKIADWAMVEKCGQAYTRLGYASGTATHNADFHTIAPIIWRVMEDQPSLRLTIIGALDFKIAPPKFLHSRIDRREKVPHHLLPFELANFDINLIPLESSSFCDSKSELKYFESAIVGVPSIAVANPTYLTAKKNDPLLQLATNDTNWYDQISSLTKDKLLRQYLGRGSRSFVKDYYSSDTIVTQYIEILQHYKCS